MIFEEEQNILGTLKSFRNTHLSSNNWFIASHSDFIQNNSFKKLCVIIIPSLLADSVYLKTRKLYLFNYVCCGMNVCVPLNFTCWNTIPLVRELGIDVYPLLYLKLIEKNRITKKNLQGTLPNVKWQPGWEVNWGENGYIYTYSWVSLLSTRNYLNIVNRLYSNTK